MTDKQIGRYEVKGQLGQGGMATVMRAYDPSFDREVAIKTLPEQFSHNDDFRERFAREAKTIAKLEHPAIVPVYDVGEEGDMPYLVMRFMTGGDLTSRIGAEGLPVEEVARLTEILAAALDHAHSQGFIHRDLKPANILFDSNDQPYIGDFGIARMIEAGGTLTGSGIIGTPTYMSPEQASGATLDHRSDIYSLAVLVYEMLTGALPYSSETPMGMAVKHMMEPVPDIRAQREDLPENVKPVIDKAMAKNPDYRYQTAAAFAEDLRRVVGGEEPLAASEERPADMGTMPMTAPMEKAAKPTDIPRKTTAPPAEEGGLPKWVLPVGIGALVLALVCGVLGVGVFGLLGPGLGVTVAEATATSEPTEAPQPTATPAEPTEEPTAETPTEFSAALESATQLRVEISLGEAGLTISEDELNGQAFQASFEIEGDPEEVIMPTVTYEDRAGTGVITITQPSRGIYVRGQDPFGTVDLELPKDIPIRLSVSGGVEPSFINLSELTITDIILTGTTAETSVRLPDSGDINITVDNAFNNVTIEPSENGSPDLIVRSVYINEPYGEVRLALLPSPTYTVTIGEMYGSVTLRAAQGVEIRVEGAPQFGTLNVPDGFEEIDETVRQSPGYDEADTRVLITISANQGTVTIER